MVPAIMSSPIIIMNAGPMYLPMSSPKIRVIPMMIMKMPNIRPTIMFPWRIPKHSLSSRLDEPKHGSSLFLVIVEKISFALLINNFRSSNLHTCH